MTEMTKSTAIALISNLLERSNNRENAGLLTTLERQAIALAQVCLIEKLGSKVRTKTVKKTKKRAAAATANIHTISAEDGDLPSFLAKPEPVILNEESLLTDGTPEDLLVCLDFGTAMSKAFAVRLPDDYIELALGKAAGRTGYTVPSSIFIEESGISRFGFDAIEVSENYSNTDRQRLDSIKSWISLQTGGAQEDLDGASAILPRAMNPTDCRLTKGDLLRVYFAYLTDLSLCALQDHNVEAARRARRRFARPCWPNGDQATWADNLMREMLADAQILADTFSGRWNEGLSVFDLKSALDQIKQLGKRPAHLIDIGVAEPVAVAAGAFTEAFAHGNSRDAFMVVDIGAGTTDFGVFFSVKTKENKHKVFQVPSSVRGVMQAGDKVDDLLRFFIAAKEFIDHADNAGAMNMAELTRRKRSLKELLFKTGQVEYQLPDGTVGKITIEDFLSDPRVENLRKQLEDAFLISLATLDDSWLKWLSTQPVHLNVVLAGGSSTLPMMQSLATGSVTVRGFNIKRVKRESIPEWLENYSEELRIVYPQLAVAIGGVTEELPEARNAPPIFGGGAPRPGPLEGGY